MDKYGSDAHEEEEKRRGPAKELMDDFDCPSCNANNPVDGVRPNDEVNCNYCGSQYQVLVKDDGRIRLREV